MLKYLGQVWYWFTHINGAHLGYTILGDPGAAHYVNTSFVTECRI